MLYGLFYIHPSKRLELLSVHRSQVGAIKLKERYKKIDNDRNISEGEYIIKPYTLLD